MSLKSLYRRMFGKDPTDQDLQRPFAVAEEFGINPEDDSFMILLATLEWYLGIFSKIPKDVKDSANSAANAAIKQINANSEQLKNSFDAYAQQSASKAIAGMVDAVKDTASKTVATNNIKFICLCSGIITIILLIIFIWGAIHIQNKAFDSGFQAGVADSRNTELMLKERDNFTKTDLFKLAVEYDKAGDLKDILECKRPGWVIKEEKDKTLCVPYLNKDNNGSKSAIAWVIPEIKP